MGSEPHRSCPGLMRTLREPQINVKTCSAYRRASAVPPLQGACRRAALKRRRPQGEASLLRRSLRRSTLRDRPFHSARVRPGAAARRRTPISFAAPAVLDSGRANPLEGNTAAILEAEGTRRPVCLGGAYAE